MRGALYLVSIQTVEIKMASQSINLSKYSLIVVILL